MKERNEDFHNILKRASFTAANSDTTRYLSEMRIDHTIWLGDLNYRLNFSNVDDVIERIELKDWAYLLAGDQLLQEKKAGNAFKYYKEGAITFAPTYKYTNDGLEYDRKKKRMPSWCDRIQWTGTSAQLFYRRVELLSSDHRPVAALFKTPVRLFDAKARSQLIKRLSALQLADFSPKVKVSARELLYHGARFDAPWTQVVRVKNLGQTAVSFCMVDKARIATEPETLWARLEAYQGPAWLSVAPYKCIILPRASVEIRFTVHVTRESAMPLMALRRLEASVVMRMEGADEGRFSDLTLALRGSYTPSAFGASLPYLNELGALPARFAPLQAGKKQQPQPPHQSPSLVPKELFRVVSSIYSHPSLADSSVSLFPESYRTASPPSVLDNHAAPLSPSSLAMQVLLLKECLDTGFDYNAGSLSLPLEAFGAALLDFLRCLAEPVLSRNLGVRAPPSVSRKAYVQALLLALPADNYQVLHYLVAFLRHLASVRKDFSADQLGEWFGGALTQSSAKGTFDNLQTTSPATLVTFLITSDADL